MIKIVKKSRSKKLIAFMLVFAMAAMMFLTSCGSGVKAGDPIMKSNYGGGTHEMSSNIFSYFLSYVKTGQLYQYNQYFQAYGMTDGITDSPELWTQEYTMETNPSIQTVGDALRLQAVLQLQQIFAAEIYCKEKDIALTKEQLNDIDVAVKELIRTDFNNSKMNFNMTLARFGLNEQIFKEIKRLEKLYSVFGEYVVSATGGIKPVSDAAIWNKFTNEYVRVKHILISTTTGEYDEEGNIVEYSEEELAERLAKADDIYNKIVGGEDFDAYSAESEDSGQETYPNGYVFARNGGFVLEFEDAAFDMKVDEVRVVESEFGIHIMKKYELTTDDILEHEAQIISELEMLVIMEELKPYTDSIEVIYEEVNEFSIVTADTMMDCLSLLY